MKDNQVRLPVAGDIVVTKVAHHYQVIRVMLQGEPSVSVRVVDREADALTLACRLIRARQRVFLYALGSKPKHILIDCAHRFWEDR
jgi:hypothetical protein